MNKKNLTILAAIVCLFLLTSALPLGCYESRFRKTSDAYAQDKFEGLA